MTLNYFGSSKLGGFYTPRKILIASIYQGGRVSSQQCYWSSYDQLKLIKGLVQNQIVVVSYNTAIGLIKDQSSLFTKTQVVAITDDPIGATNSYNTSRLTVDDLIFTSDLEARCVRLRPDCDLYYWDTGAICQQIIDRVELIYLLNMPHHLPDLASVNQNLYFPTASNSTEQRFKPYLPKDFKLIDTEWIEMNPKQNDQAIKYFTLETYVKYTATPNV
jgi:hypothetical protein